MIVRIAIYLGAIVTANLLVVTFGRPGLLVSSAVLIPFDFVLRCYFHERWKGVQLITFLAVLVSLGAIITYWVNSKAYHVALGSVGGFVIANIGAGLFYQAFIKRSYFVKVNGSDLVAVLLDSIVFQLVAFNGVSIATMFGQTVIKMLGGFFWYFILFRLIKIKV